MTHRYVVISPNHSLLPVARRLRTTGAEVHLLIGREYWEGLDGEAAGDPRCPEDLAWAIAEVESGATLVTNQPELWVPFSNGRRLGRVQSPTGPLSPVRLGGWFDGEVLRDPHLLVVDQGPWNGGWGPQWVPGGMTLVAPGPEADLELLAALWTPITAELKARGFIGLVQAGLAPTDTAGAELRGFIAGWPFLHTEVWLSDVTLPEGLDGVPHREARHTVGIPVSIGPWPWPVEWNLGTEELSTEGMTPQQLAQVFWHDVKIDRGARTITAGRRDGLIGVAVGSGHTLERARATALDTALALPLSGKQLRTDVAGTVPQVLATLEVAFGVRV